MTELFEPVDGHDRRLTAAGSGLLRTFNDRGVLEAADVHVAERVGLLGGETDERVRLALALAVRAVRHGSVCVRLDEVAGLHPDLPWPEPVEWQAAVVASPLVGRVLRLERALVYLDRYWQEEGAVVADLLDRLDRPVPAIAEEALAPALDELFGPGYEEQRAAADRAVRQWTSVITGGPGTGKTTTLARLLAALAASSATPLRIGLAAPTGKAAARMTQAIVDAAGQAEFPAAHRPALEGLAASTLHRLLGWRRDNGTRFRHHRHNRLPHDVVVVDEASMVSLTQMTRLIEAVRPDARLILVGDPDQLTSVEAGAVLQDLVRGFARLDRSPVSELGTGHRFTAEIGRFAAAIRGNRADEAWALLTAGSSALQLIDPADTTAIRSVVEGPALALMRAAEEGRREEALRRLADHRLLCAHREGPFGVRQWNRLVERWLMEATGRDWLPAWYAGQPLIVNVNDYGLRLWNGDTGVVLTGGTAPSGLHSVFDDGTAAGRPLPLTRLSDVDTAHAMTVHRSQGSQFREVSVLLPEVGSATLTRELLYTAVTRAQERVRVIAGEDSVRAAIGHPAIRATGLAERLRARLG